MPYDENGQGYSSHTSHKLDDLWRIYGMWLEIAGNVLNTPKGNYFNRQLIYIDATSGCGYSSVSDSDVKKKGSPLIFCTLASNKSVPYRAIFIDKEQSNINQLQNNLSGNQYSFMVGNYEAILPNLYIANNQLGLIFIDPNKPTEFDFGAVASFCQRYSKIDILIHLSATAQKRAKRERLSDILKILNKQFWLIRKPYREDKQFQWTYLLGCRRDIFSNYKAIDFYRLESNEAQEFFPYLNLTGNELRDLWQPRLTRLI